MIESDVELPKILNEEGFLVIDKTALIDYLSKLKTRDKSEIGISRHDYTIGAICDEFLDTSGALLGEIRSVSLKNDKQT